MTQVGRDRSLSVHVVKNPRYKEGILSLVIAGVLRLAVLQRPEADGRRIQNYDEVHRFKVELHSRENMLPNTQHLVMTLELVPTNSAQKSLYPKNPRCWTLSVQTLQSCS